MSQGYTCNKAYTAKTEILKFASWQEPKQILNCYRK